MRTPFLDWTMRCTLFIVIAFYPVLFAINSNLDLTLVLLISVFGIMMGIFSLWYTKQLPYFTWLIAVIFHAVIYKNLHRLAKILFPYLEMDITGERKTWAKEQLRSFWFSFNDTYFFLSRKDAMAFKLKWFE